MRRDIQPSRFLITHYRVDERLPWPARTALHIVQAALKVNRLTATRLIHEGAVICRGRPITHTHARFEVGDEIEIDFVPQPVKPTKGKGKSRSPRFRIVYDDPQLMVVDKPAGLLTVPSRDREKNTLKSQIDKWLAKQRGGASSTCVQRLDRGVSGLLVFAKDPQTAQQLRQQFAQRKPQRKYAAIVRGHFPRQQGTFKSYLTTDPKTLNRYSVDDPEAGELAITHYRQVEKWQDVSLVEVQLETGRRNQIRIHFAEAGHPILGDPRYHPAEAEHPLWPFKRLALHAETLGFVHPESQEFIQFSAPWPQEFRDLRRKLVRDDAGR